MPLVKSKSLTVVPEILSRLLTTLPQPPLTTTTLLQFIPLVVLPPLWFLPFLPHLSLLPLPQTTPTALPSRSTPPRLPLPLHLQVLPPSPERESPWLPCSLSPPPS